MPKKEEDFPRGGAFHSNKKTEDDDGSEHFNEEVLKSKSNQVSKSDKRKKKELIHKRKIHETDDDTENILNIQEIKRKKKNESIPMPLSHFNPDLCILGCVQEAQEYRVQVSLPGNRTANLPITEISPAYTRQLTTLAQGEDSAEDVTSLDKLFRPGCLLPIVVKSVEEGKKVQVSCVPSLVNSRLRSSMVFNGMLLFGIISSVEDHGYKLDVGIKGLHTFLTRKDSGNYIKENNDGEQLHVGQPLWCVVRLKDKASVGDGRSINVSIDPKLVQEAMNQETLSLNAIQPGMKVNAVIESIAANGLNVKVHNFEAVIHASQLPKSPHTYKVDTKIKARVLYLQPENKVLNLTGLPCHIDYNGSATHPFEGVNKGDILKGTIKNIHIKVGLFFSLPHDIIAFAALSQLSDDTKNPDLEPFRIDQVHTCRVMGFNYMERRALVTLKKSILSEKYLTVNDLKVGDIVEGTIRDVMLHGVSIKLGSKLSAFIPCMHLADVPIKNPEKKFDAGDKLKCRVLNIDTAKSKVLLTHKKTLVRSKLPLVSEYSEIRVDMELHGVIFSVQENYIILRFFGDVKGIMYSKDMSTEEVNDPSKMFYVGQVIRTRVIFCDASRQRLRLSLNFGTQLQKSSNKQQIMQTSSNKRRIIDFEDFANLKLVGATVVRQDKTDIILKIGLHQSEAVLPYSYLSDSTDIQNLLRLTLLPGTKIPEALLFRNNKRPIFTMKESFLEAARQKVLPNQFSDLQVGQLRLAVIINHQEFGVYVDLGADLRGLCPNRYLSNLQSTPVKEMFKVGQSVMIRLKKVNPKKKRFLGSLNVEEVYEEGEEGPLGLLRQYMKVRQATLNIIQTKCQELAEYSVIKVKSIVNVTVTSVFEKGILGELESGAKALATKYHFGDIEPTKGNCYEAVVLFVDPLTPCVELTLDLKIIKNVRNRKENKKSELKFGQVIKADILLVKPDFLQMALRGHGKGELVYVPARRHLNDARTNPLYKIGAYTDVVLKDRIEDQWLAVLKMNDLSFTAAEESKKELQTSIEKLERKRKRAQSESNQIVKEETTKRIKIEEQNDVDILEGVTKKMKKKTKIMNEKSKGKLGGENAIDRDKGKLNGLDQRLSLPGFSWEGQLEDSKNGCYDNEDDDDDEDDQVVPNTLESKKKVKVEEKTIQEYEKAQLTGQSSLESSADFERLVMASPNSSLVWLRYITYHVELGEIERARAVAERALKTIAFREEKEKENVWLGYLNLEILYGDQGTVKLLLARAIQNVEPLNIHLRLGDMYSMANKMEEAELQWTLATKKYKQNKNVWKAYAGFLFKASRITAARALLNRCLGILDKKDHVEVITRFATLEFSHGDAERGRTMFDNLLASYPGRTDLWSVYVDMVAKTGDIDGARSLLQRSVKMKLNTKRMSVLLQKLVRFEEKFGTEEQIQQAKDLAVDILDGETDQ